MIVNKPTSQEYSTTKESNVITIHDSAMSHIILSLTKNLYTFPEKAFLRETISNAYDANVENGKKDSPIIIRTPVKGAIEIQDFGKGITKERFEEIYTKLGNSTKRDTNDQIGKWGYGRFAALSVSNNVFITTRPGDGYAYVYNMYIDEESIKIDLCTTTKDDGSTGTTIRVYMNEECSWWFWSELGKHLKYYYGFFDNILLDFKQEYAKDGQVNASTYTLYSLERYHNYIKLKKEECLTEHFGFFKSYDISKESYDEYMSNILVGNLIYKSPLKVYYDSSYGYSTYTHYIPSIPSHCTTSPIIVRFNIGDVEFTPSREQVKNINISIYDKYLSILHFLHPELIDFNPPNETIQYSIMEKYEDVYIHGDFYVKNSKDIEKTAYFDQKICYYVNHNKKFLSCSIILNNSLLYNKKIIVYKGSLNKAKIQAIYDRYPEYSPEDIYIINKIPNISDINDYTRYVIKYLYKKNRFIIFNDILNVKTEGYKRDPNIYELLVYHLSSGKTRESYTKDKCISNNVVLLYKDDPNKEVYESIVKAMMNVQEVIGGMTNVDITIPEFTFASVGIKAYTKLRNEGILTIEDLLYKNNFYIQSILLLFTHPNLGLALSYIHSIDKLYNKVVENKILKNLLPISEIISSNKYTIYTDWYKIYDDFKIVLKIRKTLSVYNNNSFYPILPQLKNILYNYKLITTMARNNNTDYLLLYYQNKFLKNGQ